MTYQTTITKKGQITIPKEIRDALKLKEGKKVEVEFQRKRQEIRIKPSPDILDLAGMLKPKKVINPVKIREKLSKRYKPR